MLSYIIPVEGLWLEGLWLSNAFSFLPTQFIPACRNKKRLAEPGALIDGGRTPDRRQGGSDNAWNNNLTRYSIWYGPSKCNAGHLQKVLTESRSKSHALQWRVAKRGRPQ